MKDSAVTSTTWGSPYFRRAAELFELPGQSARLATMEGLRGVAIILVFFAHYTALVVPVILREVHMSRAMDSISDFCGSGVDLFFILSGYLIYRSSLRGAGKRYWQFLVRRLERIYPTFLVILGLYYVLSFLGLMDFRGPNGFKGGLYILENALFLPGIFDIRATISAAWSLSYEWAFYLSIPLIVVALRFDKWRSEYRIALFAALAFLYIAIVVAFPRIFPYFFWWEPTRVRAVMFLCGMCVYEVIEHTVIKLDRRSQLIVAALILPAVAVELWIEWLRAVTGHDATYLSWLRLGGFRSAALFIACGAIGICVLSRDAVLGKGFLAWPLRWLGNMSYSFYLTHALALHLLLAPLRKLHLDHSVAVLAVIIFVPISMTICVAVSTIAFAFIEKPFSLKNSSPLSAAAAP